MPQWHNHFCSGVLPLVIELVESGVWNLPRFKLETPFKAVLFQLTMEKLLLGLVVVVHADTAFITRAVKICQKRNTFRIIMFLLNYIKLKLTNNFEKT